MKLYLSTLLLLLGSVAFAEARPLDMRLDDVQSNVKLVLVFQNLSQQTTIPRCDFLPVLDDKKQPITVTMPDGKVYPVYANTCAMGNFN